VNRLLVAGVLSAALAAAGCAGGGAHTTFEDVQTRGGKPIAEGMAAAGLTRCVGPVAGADDGSVSLFARSGFAAVLVGGSGATQDAIALAQIRHHTFTADPAQVARRERAWRATAFMALKRADAPRACGRNLAGLPVLAPTEVVCFDQVLIPLGKPAASTTFERLLQTLYHVKVTVVRVHPQTFRYRARYKETLTEDRPYCRR
jgi:hypothetical protein